MIGIGAAIAIGVMKVMEFAGGKKGDMQSMMMQPIFFPVPSHTSIDQGCGISPYWIPYSSFVNLS